MLIHLCISVNDVVVHGLPGDLTYKTEILSRLMQVCTKNKFHADSAYTYGIGNVAAEVQELNASDKRVLVFGFESSPSG